jgi:hypothetical protein
MFFEYGVTTSYGKTKPCTSLPGSGTSLVAVSTEINGLIPGTIYHYRLVAINANDGAEPAVGSDVDSVRRWSTVSRT